MSLRGGGVYSIRLCRRKDLRELNTMKEREMKEVRIEEGYDGEIIKISPVKNILAGVCRQYVHKNDRNQEL